MSKFFKRYLFCAVIILLVICAIIYYFYGRGYDEFISVSYVLDEDEPTNAQINWNENELLNLTNFQYTNQPSDKVCHRGTEELFGKQHLRIVFH